MNKYEREHEKDRRAFWREVFLAGKQRGNDFEWCGESADNSLK